jgi:hypothetical protein
MGKAEVTVRCLDSSVRISAVPFDLEIVLAFLKSVQPNRHQTKLKSFAGRITRPKPVQD